ncbi:MAG: hypothetical protein IJV37_05900 [Bacteroidales bacterium]|nr:hypothetical protein [Bacteroidales bacterium]
MGEYQDRLKDYIRDKNLFTGLEYDSFENDVKLLTSFAIDTLLWPSWQSACINRQLKKDSESTIINLVEVAIQEVVDSCGFEEQIHEQIMSSVGQWRDDYNEYLKSGKYYEQV